MNVPYILKIYFSKDPKCREYYDRVYKKRFQLCINDLFVKIDNYYVPRAFFMYHLEKEYHLRKGHRYYHKETPFDMYNDKTMFDILKYLKQKRVKFSYQIEPLNENNKKLMSFVSGYFDYLLGKVCGGAPESNTAVIDSMYQFGYSTAMFNTIVRLQSLINTTEIICPVRDDTVNIEECRKEKNNKIVAYNGSIYSSIILPMKIMVNRKGVIVYGVGNVASNDYIHFYYYPGSESKLRIRVRPNYWFSNQLVSGFLTVNNKLLIPEYPYLVDDIIFNKTWRSVIFLVDSNGNLYEWSKQNGKVKPLNSEVISTKQIGYVSKMFSPTRIKATIQDILFTAHTFNFPIYSFNKVVMLTVKKLRNNKTVHYIPFNHAKLINEFQKERVRIVGDVKDLI